MSYRSRLLALAAAFVLALPALWSAPAAAAPSSDNGAVVIMYHRFGDERFPSTNIRLEQLRAHIHELQKDKYTVLPLPEVVAALREGRALPERAVAITVDDAYRSVYESGWPLLREAGLPFTLFVATQPADQGHGDYMTWAQIREMAESELVTIGNHTASHAHLPQLSEAGQREEIRDAQERLRAELDAAPALFAYPYGEYALTTRRLVEAAGFAAAFGQHSGAVGRTADRLTLPRFALNESYGDLERFRLAVNALPLPVDEVTPRDVTLDEADNPPLYGFTVLESAGDGLDRLACYATGRGRIEVERIARRMELRFESPFPPGRTRVNCTMPGPDGRWRWFGRQFYVPGG